MTNTIALSGAHATLVGFQPQPASNGRGTIGIIWQCIFTMTICAYTAIHLSTPTKRLSSKRYAWRKAKWLLTILLPEVLIMEAFSELQVALRVKRAFRARGLPIALRQAYLLTTGGLLYTDGDMDLALTSLAREPNKADAATEDALIRAFRFVHSTLPSTTAIRQRSKHEGFSTCITVFQSAWFIFQCVARASSGTAVSLLEVHTGANMLLCAFAYACWFVKPHGIDEPETVHIDESAMEAFQEAKLTRARGLGAEFSKKFGWTGWMVLSAVMFFYCAIHAAVVNYVFPTAWEGNAWFLAAGSIFVCFVLFSKAYYNPSFDFGGDLTVFLFGLVVVVAVPLAYFGGRLYLLGEAFVSLRAAPASVYTTPDWVAYWPAIHFG